MSRDTPTVPVMPIAAPWRRRIRLTAVAIACAFGLALFYTAQHAAMQSTSGFPVDWSQLFLTQLLHWGVWALLAPIIVVAVERYRLDVDHRGGRIAMLVLVGIVLSVMQAFAATALVLSNSARNVFGAGTARVEYRHAGAATSTDGAVVFTDRASALEKAATARIVATIGPNFVIFTLVAGVLHAMLYYRDLRTRRMRESALEARLAQAELGMLRAQLQPHFLFNTMHTVSSLMTHDVPGARRVLASLGDLLRLSMDHMSRQEVSMQEELEFLARYVDIQRARFHERLQVSVDVPPDLRDVLVPSLVLQPLVENAIRHGIEPHARTGQVSVSAWRAGDRLVLNVTDDGPVTAMSPATPTAPARQGVGLANIRSRLEQLYGASHEFVAGPGARGGFQVHMVIPMVVK